VLITSAERAFKLYHLHADANAHLKISRQRWILAATCLYCVALFGSGGPYQNAHQTILMTSLAHVLITTAANAGLLVYVVNGFNNTARLISIARLSANRSEHAGGRSRLRDPIASKYQTSQEHFEMTPIRSTRKTSRILLSMIAIMALAPQGVVATPYGDDRRGETRIYTLDPSTHGNPEGIASDENTGAFFVGATGDGTIYRGTLDNPRVTEFIPGAPGKEAAGMKVAGGKLYVAGGFSGRVSVYNIATKQLVASFASFGAGMLNDLVVTNNGDVFITDSFVPRLWHITAAQIAAGGGTPEGIPVDPEIQYDFAPFSFNLNGIVALKGGRSLIVVQSNTGKLFRIDLDDRVPYGREIHQISVEPLLWGDGLLIDGGDLLVMNGMLNFVRLTSNADQGKVIERRSDPSLRDPSTVARVGNFYLIVNTDFSNSVTPFTVTGLPRNFDDEE
jgi:sugar lactone lactonase YvrE